MQDRYRARSGIGTGSGSIARGDARGPREESDALEERYRASRPQRSPDAAQETPCSKLTDDNGRMGE